MNPLQAPAGDLLQDRLTALTTDQLLGMRRGIEKESLRAQPGGSLAMTPHPEALGSALANPNITTDFSESQVEIVTSVHAGVEACLDELTQLHPFVYRATLCPELKSKIQQTFVTLDQTPEGKKYLDNVDAERFVVMKDSDYDVIREAGGGK